MNEIIINIDNEDDYINKYNSNNLYNDLSNYIYEECKGKPFNNKIGILIKSNFKLNKEKQKDIANKIHNNYKIDLEENLLIIKYLPISPVKQSHIKLIIPLFFSSLSLLVTNISLISFNEISANCFLVSTILGLLLQVALSYSGLYIDLIKLNSDLKGNISFLSTLISVVLPLVIFLMHFLMSYFKVNSALMYVLEILLMLIILIILVIPFKKMVNKYFIKMRIN